MQLLYTYELNNKPNIVLSFSDGTGFYGLPDGEKIPPDSSFVINYNNENELKFTPCKSCNGTGQKLIGARFSFMTCPDCYGGYRVEKK